MDLIKDLWRGEVPLSKTFWLFGWGVILLLNLSILYIDSQIDILTNYFAAIVFVSLLLFGVIYSPFIFIAIWRSANKYQGLQRYAIIAKIFVIVGWSNYLKDFLAIAEQFAK
jgi:ABC-type multidrug transport system permease subunit